MLIASCCERGFHLLYCFLKLSLTSNPSVTPHGEAWHLCCRNILPGLLSSLTSLIMLFFGIPCLPLVAVAVLPRIFFQSPTREPMSLISRPLLIHTKISACFSDTSSRMCSYHLYLPECFTTPFFWYQFLQVVPVPGSSAWSSTSSVASLCLLVSWSSSWTALHECHTCSPSTQLNLLCSCHHQLILVVAIYFPLALKNTFFSPYLFRVLPLTNYFPCLCTLLLYLTKFKWHLYFQSLSRPVPTLPVTCHSVLQRALLSLIILCFPISCLLNAEHICDDSPILTHAGELMP